ncbi:MAG: hypothetical protein P8J50_13310 [Acidimicrobiales bacterium]|jgi:hypothetical protein|nr:hypothetical protein [Acidimicrobiales bacterium]
MGRKQQLIFTALLVAGVGMFIIAGLIGRTNPPDEATRIRGVEAIDPERFDEVLQQNRVAIDLEPGFVVRSFTVSPDAGCSAPVEVVDFTRITDGLNIWVYQPDEGKPISQLAPDDNCVRVVIEDIQRPGDTAEVEWTFTVN